MPQRLLHPQAPFPPTCRLSAPQWLRIYVRKRVLWPPSQHITYASDFQILISV